MPSNENENVSTVNETIVTGKKYRVLKDKINGLWNRISFWTSANDVEFTDSGSLQGKRLNEVVTSIQNSAGVPGDSVVILDNNDAVPEGWELTTKPQDIVDLENAVDELNDNLAQTPIEKGGQVLDTVDEKLNYLVANLNGKGYTNGIVDRSWFVASSPNAQFTYPEDGVYVVAFMMHRHPDVSAPKISNVVNNAHEIIYDSTLKQNQTGATPMAQAQYQIVKARAGETVSASFNYNFGQYSLTGIQIVQLKGVRNITVNSLKTSDSLFIGSYSENIEMAKTYLYFVNVMDWNGTPVMSTPKNLEQIVKEPINDSSNMCYMRNKNMYGGGEIGIINVYDGDTFVISASAGWGYPSIAVLDVTIEN